MDILEIPHEGPRVETGPVQFGDDWPGVFIRGDHALHFSIVLRDALRGSTDIDPITKAVLGGLSATLDSCRV